MVVVEVWGASPAASNVCVCVFHCLFQQSQLALTGAEDVLLPATAPNSQGVIWRSCWPPLARIDF